MCGDQFKSKCGACHVFKYCGRECQRAHWAFHKPYCKGEAVVMQGLVGLRVRFMRGVRFVRTRAGSFCNAVRWLV